MSTTQFTPRLGILVKTHGICPGHLFEYNNRCGLMVPSPFAPQRFHVKLFPVKNCEIICLPPENLMNVTHPSKETLKSYCVALRAEAKVYEDTDPPYASYFLQAVHTVYEQLGRGDQILLSTYGAVSNPDYLTTAAYLQNMLNDANELFGELTESVKSALEECSLELAKLHCGARAFEQARQVVRKVCHQSVLDEGRKEECVQLLRTILRNVPENDAHMRHRVCLEIIRLRPWDEEARQFLQRSVEEEENALYDSSQVGDDKIGSNE